MADPRVDAGRRRALTALAALPCGAALGMAGWAIRRDVARTQPVAPLGWSQFIERAQASARWSVAEGPQTETVHLSRLAQWAARPGWCPIDAGRATKGYRQEELHREGPFAICRYDVADGGEIPAHDHAGYTALMRVTRGQARLKSFDEVSRGGVRLVEDRVVRPGDLAVVSMEGFGIHSLTEASHGFQFVDLFTFYAPSAGSRRVHVGPGSPDQPEVYAARRGVPM